MVVDDCDDAYDRKPPIEFGNDWDSVKVMATEIDKKFSSSWIKTIIDKNGKEEDNTMPRMFNEYILKRTDSGQESPDYLAAVQYIVAYNRT